MASIALTGCDVFYAAHGSAQPAVRRREVVVNGRRVKTVDVHSHCVIPEALALLGLKAETQRRGLVLVVADRLSEMDALSHLIFEGTLDRFPGLKICAAHGGGYLPSYAPRSDNGCRVSPELCDSTIQLKKKPTEYIRQLYFDSLVFTSEALRHLVAEAGASQIVMGTDHPIPWQDKAVDHILDTPSLTDAERAAILGETAARLLGIG